MTRITRLSAAIPLLFTLLYATCSDGRSGFVLRLEMWHVSIVANTCG